MVLNDRKLTVEMFSKYAVEPDVALELPLTFLAQGVSPSWRPARNTSSTWVVFTALLVPLKLTVTV